MPYHRKDHYYRKAKGAGYRSRAAYKLLELARRYRLIQPGDHVVDLGAWPGGWLQVAGELVGPGGRVIGVDLADIEPIANPVIVCLRGDAGDAATRSEVERLSRGRVDVLLSDMAPKLTGIRATDEARAAALAAVAVEAAHALLRPGGRFLLKLFIGPESDAIAADLRRWFRTVKRTRPEATRAGSSELYLIALGYRPASASPPRS
jgi:23S rRNA (uridine2552-2'-O)-methyltransferase